MTCAAFSEGRTLIHRLDVRVRVLAGVAFSVLVAISHRPAVAGAALAVSAGAVLVARLPIRQTLKRLAALNVFMLALAVMLPWGAGGDALFSIGGVGYSADGLRQAAGIALKANAIVLTLTAMLSTAHLVALGHAMAQLAVPDKLVHLFFFTVRYNNVLHHEYQTLRRTMKVRCFRARFDVHTWRTFGSLVGMLLIKSFDRSQRILAAMKCRGFRGRFPAIDQVALAGRDVVFAAMTVVALCVLACMEWLWTV